MSFLINSLASSTVNTSCPFALKLEHPTTAAIPLIFPETIASMSGCKVPPKAATKVSSDKPVMDLSKPCCAMTLTRFSPLAGAVPYNFSFLFLNPHRASAMI